MALTKTAVVDTALELLHESGLAGMSMRTLATRLGVQPSALYWHVPSKQALLTAVAEQVLGGVGAAGSGRSGGTGADGAKADGSGVDGVGADAAGAEGAGSGADGSGARATATGELRAIGVSLRAAVTGVPDGAEIVALGLAAGAANPVADAVDAACARHGMAERGPGLTAALTGYVIGLSLEEQTHHNLRVADPETPAVDYLPRFESGLDALLAGCAAG